MSVEVRNCSDKHDINLFVKLPYRVYRGQQTMYDAWVPPLDIDVRYVFDRKRNNIYTHADLQGFLAWKDGEVAGRICAIVDRNFCEHKKTKTGFVGYFECIDDAEVAKALFSAAEAWLRQRDMEHVIGPVNGLTNMQIGNQIDSFDIPPVIEMPYAAPYYASFYEAASYGKACDLYSYKMNTVLKLSEKIIRLTNIAQKRNRIEIRTVKKKDWKQAVDVAREIWDEAWADNWGFVPWDKADFDHIAADLRLAVNFDLTFFAYVDDRPIGFAFPIPDLNRAFHAMNGKLLPFGIFRLLAEKKRAQCIRIAAFGVRKEFRNKGVDALFIHELYTRGESLGYDKAEFSWILENNVNLRNLLENWGAEHYRTHRMYEKEL